ncbi:MAG: hypothetical protein V4635_15685 [Bacteroidota bacterium]
MKNSKLLFFAICLLALASCQKPKDWTCTCEVKPSGGTTRTETATIKNKKSSEASTICGDYGKAQVNGNGTWNCKTN